MDLIYADKNRVDIGILKDYSFDLAFGSDENNFEITVSTENNVCDEDYLIYIEGTDYGGIIDAVYVDTADKVIKYSGRTFHGILEKKIIAPDAGADYYNVSGDANTILSTLITRLNLTGLFKASSAVSTNISYQFPRYIDAYKGIIKMLTAVGYKLNVAYDDGFIVLSAVPIVEYLDEGLDSDKIAFEIKRNYNPVNHLICLGSGELRNRTRIDLYLDSSGNVSTTQYYTGLDEIAEVYDYPNAESSDDLRKSGISKLLEGLGDEVTMDLGSGFSFDIGDKVTATDVITGTTVTRPISKKIIKISKEIFKVQYKVGE